MKYDDRAYQVNRAPKPDPLSSRSVTKSTMQRFLLGNVVIVELHKPGKYKRFLAYPDTESGAEDARAILDAALAAGCTGFARSPHWRVDVEDVHYFLPDEATYALFDLITYFGE